MGQFGAIGRFFEGEATSEVGLRAGVTRDLWTAVQPDIGPLMPFITEANRRFAKAPGDVQGLVIAAIAARYERNPPPATFRIIVSPLVTWIWVGALIAMVGALIAIWPAGAGARRRVTAGYAARVAQELGRARVRA
jgi:cytochrome c-type biogenesis protein CcmF